MVSKSQFVQIVEKLDEYGLLLLSDPKLPSLAGLIAGEPISGSWWGHPKGKEIFEIACQLDERKEIITAKLISGKITYVHQKYFTHLAIIGSANDRWQLQNLSDSAKTLLYLLLSKGTLETNAPFLKEHLQRPARAADELEKRLLIYAEEFHSTTGAHAKRLQSWQEWTTKRRINLSSMTLPQAKKDLQDRVESLNKLFSADGKLPWMNKVVNKGTQ